MHEEQKLHKSQKEHFGTVNHNPSSPIVYLKI